MSTYCRKTHIASLNTHRLTQWHLPSDFECGVLVSAWRRVQRSWASEPRLYFHLWMLMNLLLSCSSSQDLTQTIAETWRFAKDFCFFLSVRHQTCFDVLKCCHFKHNQCHLQYQEQQSSIQCVLLVDGCYICIAAAAGAPLNYFICRQDASGHHYSTSTVASISYILFYIKR